MKGLLKGLKYIARIFDNDKKPEMQIGEPTDVKHVAHIGWEGPSATTPSWMHDYKSPIAESKGSSNKKPTKSQEKQRNKARRKASTNANNSPAESPTRVGGSARPSRRSTGKKREQNINKESETGSKLENDQPMRSKQSKQKKSKGLTEGGGGNEPPPSTVGLIKSKETDISVRAVYPFGNLENSTGR